VSNVTGLVAGRELRRWRPSPDYLKRNSRFRERWTWREVGRVGGSRRLLSSGEDSWSRSWSSESLEPVRKGIVGCE
jgi:hypothetical protein